MCSPPLRRRRTHPGARVRGGPPGSNSSAPTVRHVVVDHGGRSTPGRSGPGRLDLPGSLSGARGVIRTVHGCLRPGNALTTVLRPREALDATQIVGEGLRRAVGPIWFGKAPGHSRGGRRLPPGNGLPSCQSGGPSGLVLILQRKTQPAGQGAGFSEARPASLPRRGGTSAGSELDRRRVSFSDDLTGLSETSRPYLRPRGLICGRVPRLCERMSPLARRVPGFWEK